MLINLKLSPAGYYNITKGLDIKGDLNVDTTPFDGDTRYIIECLPPYARDILHQLEDINYLKDYPSVEYDIRFTLQRFIDEFKSLD